MGFDPNSVLAFLQAQGGNSSLAKGNGPVPPPDQVPMSAPSPALSAPAPMPQPQQASPQPQAAPQQPQLADQQMTVGTQPQQPGPQITGIKGYLSNILYNMGEATKAHLGMPTDAQLQLQQAKAQTERMTAVANANEAQQRGNLYGAQAAQMKQSVTLPNGMQVPFGLAKPYLDAWAKQYSADVGANARIGAAQIGALARMGQVTMKAAYMPDGTLGVGLYDKAGQFKGYADNAVVPADYMEKIHHGQEFKVDADGTLQAIPTTSTSAPMVPRAPGAIAAPSPAGTPAIQGPPGTPATTPASPTQAPLPGAPNSPTINKLRQGAAGGQATPVTNAKPVTANGQPFRAPSAADVGNAYDPQTNQYYITNRADAARNGYQNFIKSSPAQIENDRQLNNRVADVEQKMGRYQQTFQNDLSDRDVANMSALISDNHFKLPLGTELPTGWLASLATSSIFQNMSPQAQQRFLAFVNAREAMSGYQRVLTGSSRGGEKNLQLQLDVLPSPLWKGAAAQEGFNQFGENLKLAAQGLPRMKGVQTPGDINQKFGSSQNNAPPPGAKIRDYTQLR